MMKSLIANLSMTKKLLVSPLVVMVSMAALSVSSLSPRLKPS